MVLYLISLQNLVKMSDMLLRKALPLIQFFEMVFCQYSLWSRENV